MNKKRGIVECIRCGTEASSVNGEARISRTPDGQLVWIHTDSAACAAARAQAS